MAAVSKSEARHDPATTPSPSQSDSDRRFSKVACTSLRRTPRRARMTAGLDTARSQMTPRPHDTTPTCPSQAPQPFTVGSTAPATTSAGAAVAQAKAAPMKTPIHPTRRGKKAPAHENWREACRQTRRKRAQSWSVSHSLGSSCQRYSERRRSPVRPLHRLQTWAPAVLSASSLPLGV